MECELRQAGRSMLDFEVSARRLANTLQLEIERTLADAGVDADALPDDMNQRHAMIEKALAGSPSMAVRELLAEWCAREHGRAALSAFSEIRPQVQDRLDELLRKGPSRIVRNKVDLPPYWNDTWFHRTEGGWDGSDYQGYVHAEIVHRQYVAKVFPGDIYGNRREVLTALPASREYARILEIGTSSGHHTVAIAESFPDARITGIDPSVRMLEQAARVANENGWAWDLHVGLGESMDMFDPDSFDLMTAYAVHHELPTQVIREMFAEIYRVLEPGGDMIIADIARTASRDRMSGWRMDWSAMRGGEPFWRSSASLDLGELAQAAGFSQVRAWEPRPGSDPYIVYGRKPA